MKFSTVIIAKNEESVIKECLESVKFSDEIIVVCNQSTDKTAEIAENFGAKVFEIDSSDFSKLRNYGFEKASNEWVFYIDADERVDSKLKNSIAKAIQSNDYSAYFINRKNYYLGKNEWPHAEKILRLFKKSDFLGWKGVIHETAYTKGKTSTLNGYLLHFTHRDLESMVEKTAAWSTIEAQIRFDSNHPKMSWWRFPRVMATAFLRSYIFQKGYKAGATGLIESIFQSFSSFITYAKLWEMQNKERIQQAKLKSFK